MTKTDELAMIADMLAARIAASSDHAATIDLMIATASRELDSCDHDDDCDCDTITAMIDAMPPTNYAMMRAAIITRIAAISLTMTAAHAMIIS